MGGKIPTRYDLHSHTTSTTSDNICHIKSKGVGSDSFLSPILLRHFHDVFYETVGMTLLCELQPAIARAIDSLGKKPIKRVTDLFYLYAAQHLNIDVDAFILLRREHRDDGAGLLLC